MFLGNMSVNFLFSGGLVTTNITLILASHVNPPNMNPYLCVCSADLFFRAMVITKLTGLWCRNQPFFLVLHDGEVKLRVDKQHVLLILVLEPPVGTYSTLEDSLLTGALVGNIVLVAEMIFDSIPLLATPGALATVISQLDMDHFNVNFQCRLAVEQVGTKVARNVIFHFFRREKLSGARSLQILSLQGDDLIRTEALKLDLL